MTATAAAGPTDGDERLDAVREATNAVVEKFGRPYWRTCLAERRRPIELERALGESGLLGLGVPSRLGGSDGDLVDQVVMVETIGRAGLPLQAFLIGNFVRHTVLKHGNQAQIDWLVPRTLSAEYPTSFAITEADSGSNAFAMRTKAERTADGWRINGQKAYITGAGDASQMMVVARTAPRSTTKRSSGLSLFLLRLPLAGISMNAMRIDAHAPETQYIVHFDNVDVPADAVVGEVDRGAECMFDALNPERLLASAIGIGLGHYLVQMGADYAKVRAPFDRPIGAYQAVQHPLARAYINLEAARAMIYQAAVTLQRGGSVGVTTGAAKVLASEAVNQAFDAAVQAHGGAAFDKDYDLMSFFEVVRMKRVGPANNEMILSQIAERALGLPKSY